MLLTVPSYVQASQTVIYAPQYYFGSGSAHSPSFLPTVVTFPATPNGQTSFTTYICYSTTTAAASSGANLTSQCPLPLQVQTIANEMSQVPPPLSTYRFPSPLATAVQHNKISEIVEGDDINNVSASDTTECFNSGISEVELPTVSVPVSSDESLPTSNQLVRRTAVPTHANARNTKAPRDTRGDKLPVTPQSILLMRRFSNCIQPYQPKASPPSEPPAKRAKKSKAKHCCKLCDQSFTRAHDLKRHNTTHESCKSFPKTVLSASCTEYD